MLQQYLDEFHEGKFMTPLEAMQFDVYTDDFVMRHTRNELVIILKHLYRDDKNTKYTKNMCKNRMSKHIKFWFELHGYVK